MTATNAPSNSIPLEGLNAEGKLELIGRVSDLRELAKKAPLRDKNDIKRRDEIVIWLVEMGFTRNQISSMADGMWDPKTFKAIVKGITSNDTTIRDNIATIFVKMLQNHLDFDDITNATALQERLSQEDGLDLENIISLERDIRQSKDLTVQEVIETFKKVRGEMSLPELKEAVLVRQQLEAAGIKKIEDLRRVIDASKKFGPADEVLEAVNKYGSIADLESKKSVLRVEVQSLNDEAKGLNNHITNLVDPIKKTIDESLSNFNIVIGIRIRNATRTSEKYAKMLSRAIFQNNELRISELIIGATEDRDVVKGIPLEFAGKLLKAAYNISQAHAAKPVISLSDARLVLNSDGFVMSGQEFELSQYIQAARLALNRHTDNLKRMNQQHNNDSSTSTDMAS